MLELSGSAIAGGELEKGIILFKSLRAMKVDKKKKLVQTRVVGCNDSRVTMKS